MSELISIPEAAARLRVHATTLRSWVREGRIPCYRLGQRFTRLDWEEVLRALQETGPHSSAKDLEGKEVR